MPASEEARELVNIFVGDFRRAAARTYESMAEDETVLVAGMAEWVRLPSGATSDRVYYVVTEAGLYSGTKKRISELARSEDMVRVQTDNMNFLEIDDANDEPLILIRFSDVINMQFAFGQMGRYAPLDQIAHVAEALGFDSSGQCAKNGNDSDLVRGGEEGTDRDSAGVVDEASVTGFATIGNDRYSYTATREALAYAPADGGQMSHVPADRVAVLRVMPMDDTQAFVMFAGGMDADDVFLTMMFWGEGARDRAVDVGSILDARILMAAT